MTALATPLERVTLVGTSVELQPMDPGHAPGLVAAYAPGTMAHFSQSVDVLEPLDADRALAYVQEARDGWARGEYLPFTVVERSTQRVLGATRLGAIDPLVPHVEIGWTWYAPDVRGSIVNPECKLLLLTHAFDELGCRVVRLKTGHHNLASQAAIAKLGATRDGVLRRDRFQLDGRLRDTIVFSILDDDWPRVRAGLADRIARHAATPERGEG